MTTVLIDGDILIYKLPEECTGEFILEKITEDEDLIYRTITWGSKKHIESYIADKIERIKELTKSKNVVICLSSKTNFRKELNPNYKAKRKTLKPVVFVFVRNLFHEKYNTIEHENLEADDLIGILATFKGNIKNIPKGEKVVWSMDKDFKTIPCTFFKEDKEGNIEKYVIDEKQADYNFMFQTLTGDTTDCYYGCRGIGEKTAQKILDSTDKTLKSMWNAVINAYFEKGQTQQEALLNARCARILRAEDYDFKKKKVKLWEMEKIIT